MTASTAAAHASVRARLLALTATALLVAVACSPAPAAAPTSPPAAKPTTAPAVATSAPAASPAAKPAASPSAPVPAASPAAAAAAGLQPDPSVAMNVGFVEFSSYEGSSWVRANIDSVHFMEKYLPNVKTTIVQSIPEGPGVVPVLTQLAQQGNTLIFANSYGYGQFLPDVAKQFPNVTFLHLQGNETGPNYGSYYGHLEEARYAEGVVAGKMTKANNIGFVGGFPFPPVISGVNAFALGVKSVNPNATVHVTWVNSWYDPPKEKEAADALLNAGADVVANHADSPATLQSAAQRGKWGMTSNADWSSAAPQAFLTGSVWNWGPYYVRVIKEVASKTYKPNVYLGSMADGVVALAPYGPAVTEDAKKAGDQARTDVTSGKLKVFQGPIKDQKGAVKVAEGQVATQEQIDSMDWLVQGVDGSTQ